MKAVFGTACILLGLLPGASAQDGFTFVPRIDVIGGACVTDSKGKPHIVYRAFCGGSRCDDRSNRGVIDATSLCEVLKFAGLFRV